MNTQNILTLILSTEEEYLLYHILLNKNWDLIPPEDVFYSSLSEIELNTTQESNKAFIHTLIFKLKDINYDLIKEYLYYLKNNSTLDSYTQEYY